MVRSKYFEHKGIVGNVWLDEQLLVDNDTHNKFLETSKRFNW